MGFSGPGQWRAWALAQVPSTTLDSTGLDWTRIWSPRMWTKEVSHHNQKWDSTQGGNAVCLASIPEVLGPVPDCAGEPGKNTPLYPLATRQLAPMGRTRTTLDRRNGRSRILCLDSHSVYIACRAPLLPHFESFWPFSLSKLSFRELNLCFHRWVETSSIH